MIAKRIARETSGSYRRLAEYIAAAKDPGEKLDQIWVVNTTAGDTPDNLDLSIHEIEATQALNTRVKGDKSYHLVVSFRDEQPAPEALRDIERAYAKALGFEAHQRVAATHQNTDNYHLHIAFNKIHPETARVHTPHRDFRTLEKVSRAMEQKHGLKVDLGREDKIEADQKPQAARDMEAHSWEQSFFSYVQENKKPLLKVVDEAQGWQDLHEAFHDYDLYLKKHGNGLIISNGNRSQHIKASALDRSCSKAALEKRLGPFQPRKRVRQRTPPVKHYKRRPTTKARGQGRLWRRYLSARKGRDSLTATAIRTWRDFLLYSAIEDPLAMAIIYAQKKMIESLSFNHKGKARSPLPAHGSGALPTAEPASHVERDGKAPDPVTGFSEQISRRPKQQRSTDKPGAGDQKKKARSIDHRSNKKDRGPSL